LSYCFLDLSGKAHCADRTGAKAKDTASNEEEVRCWTHWPW